MALVKAIAIAACSHHAALELWPISPFECRHPVPRGARAAGYIFVGYEVFDLFFMAATCTLSIEYALHHALHVAIGVIFIRLELAPWLVTVLLLQETSSILLNLNHLLRSHLSKSHALMGALRAAFAVTFVLYRTVMGPAALGLYAACASAFPSILRGWVMWGLLGGGYAMQLYWTWRIAKHARTKDE